MKILFRYTGFPLGEHMRTWPGHAAKWCWWCIYDCLVELGHEVVPMNWNDEQPPPGPFDAVFSIQHLEGLEDVAGPETIKIIRTTMMDRFHHNDYIMRRVAETNARRASELIERRLLPLFTDPYWSFDQADHLLILGNDVVRSTYPSEYRDRMVLHNTCAFNKPGEIVMRDYIPEQRAFLYHAGSGAVHKGLDLVLEAFADLPDLTLHVTGNYRAEEDFLAEYAKELALPNIHFHGWVVVQSKQFKDILNACYAFILPTCSEGQSPAVATCLSLGLYPIISKWTGHDLPEGCGTILPDLTVDAVKEAILSLPGDDELLRQVSIMQAEALVKYSGETFRNTMMRHLKEWL